MPYAVTGGALARDFGLGGFWDDVYKVAGTVQQAAGAVSSIKRGETQVALVPSGGASIVQPMGSGMFAGVGVPINWPLYAAVGLAAYLLLSRRR